MTRYFSVAVLLCASAATARADTIHVYSTDSIQTAIDNAAVSGDEIIVHPGTYVERLDLLGKALVLRSSEGAGVTIVDGARGGSVITCVNGEGADTRIEGFTITNGSVSNGGGMYNELSSPTLNNCTFSENSANNFGGGLYNYGSHPTLTDCTFSGNSADYGGGMHNYNSSSPALINCTFSGNSATYLGGGMLNDNNSPTLINCTFSGNSANYNGAGMYNIYSSTPTLVNCICWGNTAPNGPAFYDEPDSTTEATYSCITGGWSGEGNIDADPLFVDPDGTDDILGTADDNLRLLAGSPCIDSGLTLTLPATDKDGHRRAIDDPATSDRGLGFAEIVDMGAYEFGSSPPTPVLPGDMDEDGDVDGADMQLFVHALLYG